MRRTLIALMGWFVVNPAAAQYVEALKIAETPETIVYVEPGTLKKDGDLRRIWIVYDQKARRKAGGDSSRLYQEFDCKEPRTRVLSLINYSAPMGRGNIVSKEKESDVWEVIVLGTADETVFGYVCKE